jgi:hypothetical protein
MPSPFPGMDPYLESHWGDIHHRLITYACDQLTGALPAELCARIEEHVFVESPEGRERSIVPDLRVIGPRRVKKSKGQKPAESPANGPLILQLDEPVTQGYIEIRDRTSGMRVVTVIEMLSLANKVPGEGQDKYRKKQQELRNGHVSLVEIDLLRAGTRLLPIPLARLPESHRTPYQVCVRRGWEAVEVEIYAVPLRQALPKIKIPLRQTDPDAVLELQPLIEQCYRNGRYEQTLDYRAAPDPPLDREDARWADKLLREAGLRGRKRPPNGSPPRPRS